MIKALFLDIGGVLLTNGWGSEARKGACEKFKLEYKELDDRHRLVFDTYETGKMSLKEYLNEVVFYKTRTFTMEQFVDYMYSVSQPHDDMIEMIREMKKKYRLKVAVVSNEGGGITEYRLNNFGLKEFVDYFVVSCFVHLKKPDLDIWKLALNIGQVKPEEVIYIDDRELLVGVGKKMGLNAIRHKNVDETKMEMERLLKANDVTPAAG